jgi:hypothetical protein
VPADFGELSELDAVRTRLIDRVARRAPEIIDADAASEPNSRPDPA